MSGFAALFLTAHSLSLKYKRGRSLASVLPRFICIPPRVVDQRYGAAWKINCTSYFTNFDFSSSSVSNNSSPTQLTKAPVLMASQEPMATRYYFEVILPLELPLLDNYAIKLSAKSPWFLLRVQMAANNPSWARASSANGPSASGAIYIRVKVSKSPLKITSGFRLRSYISLYGLRS